MFRGLLLLSIAVVGVSLTCGTGMCEQKNRKSSKITQNTGSVCSEASPDFNVEACELEEQEAKTTLSDKQLNKIYKKIISDLDAEQKNDLVAAQRLWVQFQKKDCDFQDTIITVGSPIRRSIVYSGCREEHISIRIKQLKNFCSGFGVKCD